MMPWGWSWSTLMVAWRPEYVEPTFVYQGGMLTTGLWRYAAFTGISFAIRKMLLAYMFPAEDLQEQLEVGFVSATALNPATARTVKEIAAEEKTRRPNFRFQAGDQRNALRFKLIVQRMLLRSRLANTCIGIGALHNLAQHARGVLGNLIQVLERVELYGLNIG